MRDGIAACRPERRAGSGEREFGLSPVRGQDEDCIDGLEQSGVQNLIHGIDDRAYFALSS